ncbi:MAG: serine/threonine-protein kinase [Deltaproteobacteria bacterium]|nr:serine/threonine-protein kinase [Deltaproteobacteria bacterium]
MTVEQTTEEPTASEGGTRLGRYELLGEIAAGGMATVFLARSVGARGFQRLVAIKRMHPHLERDEEFVTAFLEEARLAARIRHPNVVATLDVEDGDAPFLVMEYIEGDRLSGLVKEHVSRHRAGLPLGVALRIAIDALEGLHAAHELRDDDGMALDLIHRDISPQNVLVGTDGVVRVTDFGIAKAAGRASHTREGELKGKLAYMAPEQFTSPELMDRRLDIFAMAVVTWEMLTGRRLFRAATDVETIGVILHQEIPTLRSVSSAIPERVEQIVMRALDKNPNGRWRSAQDFGRALESLGLAVPNRVVADFVKETVGDKIERERARLRSGWSVNTPMATPSRRQTSERIVSEVRRAQTQESAESKKQPVGLYLGLGAFVLLTLGAGGVLLAKSMRPTRSTVVYVERTSQQPSAATVVPTVIPNVPVVPEAASQDAGVAVAEPTPAVHRVRPSRVRTSHRTGVDDSDILGVPTFDRDRRPR